jgi:DNA-binding MurR/RpiR family transcriptional regulator
MELPVAPATLEALRLLVSDIHGGHSTIALGPRAFQTLARLVDEPHLAAVSTITDLATRLDINASTLTRLAKRLGYEGFSDLQGVFRRHVAGSEENHYIRQINRLTPVDGRHNDTLEVFLRVVGKESSNLAKLAAGVDPEQLAAATSVLCNAKQVRIHGLRQFYSLANFFSYGLGLIRNQVSILGDTGHGVAHSLSQLTDQDLLVVLGCNPYTRATVDAGRVAAGLGIPLLAFTDSSASPLAAHADCTFVIPSTGDFYVNSTAAWVALLEGLLTLIARELGEQAKSTLRSREALFQSLGISI